MSIMSCLSVVFLPLRRRILSMSSCAVYASTSVVVLRRSPAFSCHILVWRWPRRGTSLANSPVRVILSLLLAPVLWLSVWSVCVFEYLFVWVFPNLPGNVILKYASQNFQILLQALTFPFVLPATSTELGCSLQPVLSWVVFCLGTYCSSISVFHVKSLIQI